MIYKKNKNKKSTRVLGISFLFGSKALLSMYLFYSIFWFLKQATVEIKSERQAHVEHGCH